MLTLNDYIELFSPNMQEKKRFMALAEAVLGQAAELLALVQEDFLEAYDLETATGMQLDTLGAIVNVPRLDANTSDEDYRFYLRARVTAHHWDGTNESLPEVLEAAFPGRTAKLIDNQDGTVSASLSGRTNFDVKDIFPCPAGIRMISG